MEWLGAHEISTLVLVFPTANRLNFSSLTKINYAHKL